MKKNRAWMFWSAAVVFLTTGCAALVGLGAVAGTSTGTYVYVNGALQSDYRYPYDAADGRENESAPDEQMRIIRSGSFHNPSPIVRCAARYWLSPTVYQDNVGFRVVLSL
jgi:hypothetical protein